MIAGLQTQENTGGRTRHRVLLLPLAAVLVLLSGCHKKAKTSRQSYPPPPPVRRARGTASARRPVQPPLTVPELPPIVPGGDNSVPLGTVVLGYASWYAPSGNRSANGEVYDGTDLTAAHRTLPLGTVLRVTNLATTQSVTVRITDRGPFVHGRMLDLSTAAAKSIGVYRMGVAPVRMEILRQRPDASPVGRWCVQIGAFADAGNADRLRSELAQAYRTTARVIEFQGATGMWVRVNPLQSDRAHATAIVRSVQVAEPAAQAWLVRLD